MALPAEKKRQFDEQAELARAEFQPNWERWTAKDVAAWWFKWCRFGGTNHDRLGRILMEETGVKPPVIRTGVELDFDPF